MGHPAEKRRQATYADYEAVPAHQVAEIIDGTLYVFPRPAPKHARASSQLGVELGPFDPMRSGPGGWQILDEPELHLVKEQPVSPDLAGWRVERMSELPDESFFTLAPDWICEVLSPSTEGHDREIKMPLYAAHGVRWAWLVDPIQRTLEVFRLANGRQWGRPMIYRNDACVRAMPFEAIDLNLAVLWAH